MQLLAGVDIGGTITKVGVLGDNFDSTAFDTPRDGTRLIDEIVTSIKKLCHGRELSGIGVGCPGAVDLNGKVDYMPNLGLADFNIAERLKTALKTFVAVTNDANAAALGESKRLNFSDSVMLTLGTGVGSGIIIGGKIYEGRNGKAAEMGHIIVEVGGRKCGCGMNGCLEAYVSATALIEATKQAMLSDKNSVLWELCPDLNAVDGKLAFEAERLGDRQARDIIANYVKYLSVGIINICNIFRPEAVIIGGGVSNQGENLLTRVREICLKSNYGYKNAPIPQILKAKLGSLAGLYGAIEYIKYKVEDHYERP